MTERDRLLPSSFADLLKVVPGARIIGEAGGAHANIKGLSSDSRAVRPGVLFIALRGSRHDGHRHIARAIEQGAVAVIGEDESFLRGLPVPAALVSDARRAMGLVASAFYGHPSHHMALVGVTGTDGKTTTTHLVASVLNGAGRTTGLLSTVGFGIGDKVSRNETAFTTPESPEVQRRLAEMAQAGCRYVALEVSSHAIATHRVTGCSFDVGVFTNLTREHLDYHRTVEEYFETKAQLFSWLGEGPDKGVPRAAVLNTDDPRGRELARRSRVPVVGFGIEEPAAVSAASVQIERNRTSFTLVTDRGSAEVRTCLVGRHNVYNWLAAFAVGISQGIELETLAQVAEGTNPIHGRLQWVERGQPFSVLVDFAHTPNALRQTLDYLRSCTRGRVIAVFGHAGGRDPYNRLGLGSVAAELADYFVITSDDPGDEDPAEIAKVIAAAATAAGRSEGRDFRVVIDRREAFSTAFAEAKPGDAVLLAGRGHERYMPIANGARVEFDDVVVAMDLLDRYA